MKDLINAGDWRLEFLGPPDNEQIFAAVKRADGTEEVLGPFENAEMARDAAMKRSAEEKEATN